MTTPEPNGCRPFRLSLSTRTTGGVSPLAALDLAAELGYDGVEVWAEDAWNAEVDPTTLRARAVGLGLSLTVHAAASDLNPISNNAGIGRESTRQIVESLELARAIGAAVVTVHPGRATGMRFDPERLWPRQIDLFGRIAEHSTALGLHVGVEAMERATRHFVASPASVKRLLDAVGSPSLGYTLDVAHAHTIGHDPAEYVQMLGLPLLVHFSDASPRRTHHPIGDGETDLVRALEVLFDHGYRGAVVSEGSLPGRDREILDQNLRRFDVLCQRTLTERTPPCAS
ncbi:MAG: sugar phosphate isomerase/epimerase [Chloroflexi bacterium]|nr:sugar phosphate isomerase/epimerase [Chloroflexota bacterium]